MTTRAAEPLTPRPLRGEPRKAPDSRQVGPIAVETAAGLLTGLAVSLVIAAPRHPFALGDATHGAAWICAVLGWCARRRPAYAAGLFGFVALIAGRYFLELVLG